MVKSSIPRGLGAEHPGDGVWGVEGVFDGEEICGVDGVFGAEV